MFINKIYKNNSLLLSNSGVCECVCVSAFKLGPGSGLIQDWGSELRETEVNYKHVLDEPDHRSLLTDSICFNHFSNSSYTTFQNLKQTKQNLIWSVEILVSSEHPVICWTDSGPESSAAF